VRLAALEESETLIVPVPESNTVCDESLVAMVSEPFSEIAAVGENCTLIVQLAADGSELPQLLVSV
jgi:hypothetical protein